MTWDSQIVAMREPSNPYPDVPLTEQFAIEALADDLFGNDETFLVSDLKIPADSSPDAGNDHAKDGFATKTFTRSKHKAAADQLALTQPIQ